MCRPSITAALIPASSATLISLRNQSPGPPQQQQRLHAAVHMPCLGFQGSHVLNMPLHIMLRDLDTQKGSLWLP